MIHILSHLHILITKVKCLLFKRKYRCIHGMQAYDDEFVLSFTQKWVIKEVLQNIAMDTVEQRAFYLIHKCEKNGLSVAECMFLLNIFDFHNANDFFDMDCGCAICDRLNRYSPARV